MQFTPILFIEIAIAYVIILAIIITLNKIESSMDKKLNEIAEKERIRKAEERARKRNGNKAATSNSIDSQLAVAAVAAVHQFRAEHENQ